MSAYRSPESEKEEGEDGCDDESGSVATQAQLLRKRSLTMVNEVLRKSSACLAPAGSVPAADCGLPASAIKVQGIDSAEDDHRSAKMIILPL